MDPVAAVTIGKALGKLLSVGYGLYKAGREYGQDLDKDVAAIQGLADLGMQLAGWLPAHAPPRLQAQGVALLTSAFGQAWREHFGPRYAFENPREITEHFEAAVQWALGSAGAGVEEGLPAARPMELAAMLKEPAQTPCYRALWDAFLRRDLANLRRRWSAPLIEIGSGADRRRFEQIFSRACAEALSSRGGRELSAAVLELPSERAAWVQRLLIGDLATWGERHVFGNVLGHAALPEMPLSGMYVEPLAVQRGQPDDRPGPVRARIRELLKRHPLVVVSADFGHGKSLTARHLALDAARRFLEDKETPGPELELPVFIRCQEALTDPTIELRRIVQRAQWHQLRALGAALRETDAALGPPAEGQSTLFLIDGLDEAALVERVVVDLLRHLRGQILDRHRGVIFSRPHSLPTRELEQWGIPVLELCPFDLGRTDDGSEVDGGQVGQWLARWNRYSQRPAVTVDAFRERDLLLLAQTPILLFMIAYTWGDLETLYPEWQARTDATPQAGANAYAEEDDQRRRSWALRNRLYEAFFRAIAWGKYQYDVDQHPHIAAAARHVLARMKERELLPNFPAPADSGAARARTAEERKDAERTELTAAMLWLMARVAWESRCMEQQNKELNLRRVENLLEAELGVEDDATQHVISNGLLLALQADLARGGQRILFGHKSFREFLVARCWEAHLLLLVTRPEQEEKQERLRHLEGVLRRGRLLDREDRSFDFLRARLFQWPEAERRRLFDWAERTFNDDRLEAEGGRPTSLLADTRYLLREAALAIGSAVRSERGIRAGTPFSLRSLIASFWARNSVVLVDAPGLESPGAMLRLADIEGVDLTGADLREAHLGGASLALSNLRGIDLSRARVGRADLGGADLRGAKLRGAYLKGTDFSGADLRGADLGEALLSNTDLRGAKTAGTRIDALPPNATIAGPWESRARPASDEAGEA